MRGHEDRFGIGSNVLFLSLDDRQPCRRQDWVRQS